MTEKLKIQWFYGIMASIVAIYTVSLYKEFFWILLLPIALLIVSLAFLSVEKLVLLIVFFTPLSINFADISFGIGMSLPTDPLLFAMMLLFLIKLAYQGKFDRKIINHPVSIAILINIGWIGFTTITSEMPIVSMKFLVSRLWFVCVFYFLMTQIFKHYNKTKTFLWMYIIPFTIVILYTLIHHATFGFEEKPGHWVMSPFYKDHTSYGAMLAFYFPVLIAFAFNPDLEKKKKTWAAILIGLFSIALVFSYTRAAWVSLIGALAVYLAFRWQIKLRTILLVTCLAGTLLLMFWNTIILQLEQNRQDSSSDLGEHVQSISNISTDASNLERINRWNSAFRMFLARPVLGWGPGTYMFQYAPFQKKSEKTIISTNAGDKGNAHSEYLGPLSESGILGMISFLAIIIASIYTAARVYKEAKNREVRLLAVTAIVGLTTYFIHGVLNNFLDTDKASAPFWGFIALLVTLDVYHRNLKDPATDQGDIVNIR